MARKVQYSLNFDLNQKKIAKYYDRDVSNAYHEIQTWMRKHDVEHRQGSGYNTKQKITEIQLSKLLNNLNKDKPWLLKCSSVLDYYEVGKRKEVVTLLETYSAPSTPNKKNYVEREQSSETNYEMNM